MTVSVELEQATIDKYYRRAIRQIAKKAKFPGFRPGKAPDAIVVQTYGQDYIEAQALDMLLDEVYPDILKEADIDPTGPGSLETVELPRLTFSVPLAPVVELGDYRSMRKPYELVKTTDEDVEKVIMDIRRSFATSEPVERPIQEGDQVFFEISSKLVKPAEGEDPEIFKQMPYQVIAGEEDQTGYFYPDFSKELIGLSEGEEKTFKHKYPKDASIETLQGKQVEFRVKVQSIKVLQLPELDDDFAKEIGQFENVDELRKDIFERLQERKTLEYDEDYLGNLIDEIVENSTVKYADTTLQEEIDEIIESLKADLAEKKMELDAYLKSREMDLEAFIEQDARPAAQKRLARSLVLRTIAEKEELRLDNQELQSAITRAMMEVTSYIDPGMFKIKQKRDDLAQAITMDTANRLFNQQLMGRLKDIASGALEEKEKQAALEAKAKAKAEAKEAKAKAKAEAELKEEATVDTVAEQEVIAEKPETTEE